MIGAVRGWSWSEQHAKFRVKPGVPVHDLAKGLPMLRPSITQILVAAACAGLVSVPADAQVGRGSWHNGSWYADDRAPQAAERGPPRRLARAQLTGHRPIPIMSRNDATLSRAATPGWPIAAIGFAKGIVAPAELSSAEWWAAWLATA